MRNRGTALVIFCLFFGSFASAQPDPNDSYPFKDLVFAQVAVGGGYETLITIANPGTEAYSGTLRFYKGKAQAWNPTVNGSAISNGQLAVSLPAGATRSFTVTGGSSTESGFALIKRADLNQTNFVEGNLTYFVKSGTNVLDGVGVIPSAQVIRSTIPFEDFLTVALAFANTDTAGRPANVKLTVYSDSGTQAATRTLDALQPLEHLPTFLYQLFPGVTLTRGYVDIQSDVPVSGTALTFVQSQFSSLPLNPSFGIYNMNTTVSGIPTRGQLTLWKEGVFINGILRVIEVAGTPIPPEVYLAHGELSEGKLKLLLNVKGQSTFGFEILAMATSSLPFDFSQTQFEGSYLASFVGQSQTQTGTFYAERVR